MIFTLNVLSGVVTVEEQFLYCARVVHEQAKELADDAGSGSYLQCRASSHDIVRTQLLRMDDLLRAMDWKLDREAVQECGRPVCCRFWRATLNERKHWPMPKNYRNYYGKK